MKVLHILLLHYATTDATEKSFWHGQNAYKHTYRVGRAANHQCNTNNVTLYFIEGANGIHVQSGSYTHSSYTSAQKLFHVTC